MSCMQCMDSGTGFIILSPLSTSSFFTPQSSLSLFQLSLFLSYSFLTNLRKVKRQKDFFLAEKFFYNDGITKSMLQLLLLLLLHTPSILLTLLCCVCMCVCCVCGVV